MRSLHIPTPLLPHDALSTMLGKSVLLKLENLQPSGSFKLRGIGRLCQRVEPACGAALAVAYQGLDVLAPYRRPLFVVCGGIAVDLEKLTAWREEQGSRRASVGNVPRGA